MKTILRWLGYGVAFLLVVVLAAAGYIWFASERALGPASAPPPLALAAPTPEQLADGKRQLQVLGCMGCHGKNLQGGLFFNEPAIAMLYSSNLTRLTSASDAALDRAIRQGIGVDGRPLFIMPSPQYQYLTGAEAAALIAALRALPTGGETQPANRLGPIGRLGLATGKFQTAPLLVAEYAQQRLPDYGEAHARGRHLVETLCTECHGALLKGREIKPGTISPDLVVVGAYNADQFRQLLRAGKAVGDRKLDMMTDVAKNNFQYLRDDEIEAIFGYLQARVRQGSTKAN